MGSWRDHILAQFTPKVARLTLVADPDGLILEEGILQGIRERGFELIPFDDAIAFRYAYESRFRSRWDQGEHTDLVVVLRSRRSDLGSLPYDLLQAGRKLSFSLGDIFPNLSWSVVSALDRGDLNALYEAQERHAPGQLGENATKDFVLRHVFEIAPELIKQPSDLMRVLLRRHYCGQRIPTVLEARLIQLLRHGGAFDQWPLDALVSDREAFLAFLQERWPVFLDHVAYKGASTREVEEPYGLAIKGPVDLPFDHHDVRGYIDSLFLEGLLHPVSHQDAKSLKNTWASIGVRTDPGEDRSHRQARLIESLEESVPGEDARHGDWLHFANGWAELVVLSSEQAGVASPETCDGGTRLQARVDAAFARWVSRRYAGLINLPPTPPVMLHHLPRFLARQLAESSGAKIALIVVDGLSLDQWFLVREALAADEPGLSFQQNAVFAWIPSITSVSRQAAFSGKAPIFFPNSIQTTGREPALWAQFWADQGLAPHEIVYARGLGDGSLEGITDVLSDSRARAVGLVIDKVDKIIHGMELGTAGMHNQVRQWAQQPYLRQLLNMLLGRGFRVFLTSDHGNIEAVGCGRPAEGVVADVRGERVRIYGDVVLRRRVKELFPTATEWEPVGLPETYLALLAPGRQAFVREGERTVCHGGISLEELIVPLVQVERRGE